MPKLNSYSIGVDMGGTNLRAAAVDAQGRLLKEIAGSTKLSKGRDAVLSDMVRAIRALASEYGPEALAGVGVAVPGFIRIEEGLIVGSNNLPAFEDFPMRDAVSERLGKPVILENDANAAALGEKWMGAGRKVNDLVLLTLGTGIGGGIISGGRVLHGFVGMAGELGHMTVNPSGNPCGCGNQGCLEKHASATAVTSMAKLMALGDKLTSEDVYNIAMAGGEEGAKAKRIFQIMGESLGIAIGNLVNVFNFPLYLLSGGMLPAWKLFAPAMIGEARRRSFTFRHSQTRIDKATLGNKAGLIGAAYLPLLDARDAARGR